MRTITFEGLEYEVPNNTVAVAQDSNGKVFAYSAPVIYTDGNWCTEGEGQYTRIVPIAPIATLAENSLMTIDPLPDELLDTLFDRLRSTSTYIMVHRDPASGELECPSGSGPGSLAEALGCDYELRKHSAICKLVPLTERELSYLAAEDNEKN